MKIPTKRKLANSLENQISPQKKINTIKIPGGGKVFETPVAEATSPGIFAGSESVPVTNFRRDFEAQAKKFREMLTIGETPKIEGAYPEYLNKGKPLIYPNKSEGKTEILPDLEKRIKTVNESVLSSEQNALITELVELGKKDPEQLEEILQEASNPSASSTEDFDYSKKNQRSITKRVIDAYKTGMGFASALQKQMDKFNIKLGKKYGADFSTSADRLIEQRRLERGMPSKEGISSSFTINDLVSWATFSEEPAKENKEEKINYARNIVLGGKMHSRAIEEANKGKDLNTDAPTTKLTSKYDNLALPRKEAYDQLLARLRNLSYPQYLSQLKAITASDRLTKIFNSGFDVYSKVQLSRDEIVVPVASLLPTQNQLSLEKALKYPFTGKEPVKTFYADGPITIVSPIITFNHTFIIDGHHRWAQIAVMNPRATVTCIDFKSDVLTPIQFLKLIQGAIAMEEGEVITAEKTTLPDIFKSSVKLIKEYVEKNLQDSVKGEIAKQINATSNDDALDFIIANILSLKYNNLPAISSPNREKMPQVYDTPAALDVVQNSPAISVATENYMDANIGSTTPLENAVQNAVSKTSGWLKDFFDREMRASQQYQQDKRNKKI